MFHAETEKQIILQLFIISSKHTFDLLNFSLILFKISQFSKSDSSIFGCICYKPLLCEQEKIYTDLTTPPLLIARSCSEVSLRLISPLCEPSGLLRAERGTLSPTIVSNQVSLRSRLPSRRVTRSVMQSALQHVTWHLRMKWKVNCHENTTPAPVSALCITLCPLLL